MSKTWNEQELKQVSDWMEEHGFMSFEEFNDSMKENETKICCLCGKKFKGFGNNPYPVKDDGECCDSCNDEYVIPARISKMFS